MGLAAAGGMLRGAAKQATLETHRVGCRRLACSECISREPQPQGGPTNPHSKALAAHPPAGSCSCAGGSASCLRRAKAKGRTTCDGQRRYNCPWRCSSWEHVLHLWLPPRCHSDNSAYRLSKGQPQQVDFPSLGLFVPVGTWELLPNPPLFCPQKF